jgi:hypothetical protein
MCLSERAFICRIAEFLQALEQLQFKVLHLGISADQVSPLQDLRPRSRRRQERWALQTPAAILIAWRSG